MWITNVTPEFLCAHRENFRVNACVRVIFKERAHSDEYSYVFTQRIPHTYTRIYVYNIELDTRSKIERESFVNLGLAAWISLFSFFSPSFFSARFSLLRCFFSNFLSYYFFNSLSSSWDIIYKLNPDWGAVLTRISELSSIVHPSCRSISHMRAKKSQHSAGNFHQVCRSPRVKIQLRELTEIRDRVEKEIVTKENLVLRSILFRSDSTAKVARDAHIYPWISAYVNTVRWVVKN